ncbi:MAG: hypothetical protein QNJ98_00635 [Planctomycetota bacterium]|nr:hypothetical protein [Planctomycetota bacterium]
MDGAFVHYEILGPRASLDGWLAVLQDLGTCHLADAMHGLEGENGIARPEPSLEELQAELVRSEAGRALRAVERVLPPSRTARGVSSDQDRPDWQLAPGAGDAVRLSVLRDESLGLSTQIRERLEAVSRAEEAVERQDALAAAARVAAARGAADCTRVRVLALPRSTRRIGRLARRLRKTGLTVHKAHGRRTRVVVLLDVPGDAEIQPIASSVGALALAFDADVAGRPAHEVRARVVEARDAALRTEQEARAALLARVAEVGPRARLLLDALEDADTRMDARKQLAATRHVAAARVYVRRENAFELRDRMLREFGDVVVLRPLAEAGDEPTVPRQVAPVPLGALAGLRPRTYGDVPMASLLALFAPIAVGAIWADVAGGLVLLLAGALLGAGAGVGSPRRDTALLGQVAGFVCLLFGVLSGRAFGAAGEAWFGTGWGLAPGVTLLDSGTSDLAAPFVGVLYVLGQVALGVAAWGVLLMLQSWRGEHVARARARLTSALYFACVAGLAFGALPPAHAMHALWPMAPAAILVLLVLGGARAFLFGLALDLVGVLRLVVVGGGALLLFERGFAAFVDPTPIAFLVVPPALLVGALAVLADPAHLAMGVPYDLSLGGRRFTRPFAPLARRVRLAGG